MTPLPFRINDVIDNATERQVLPGPCRVLGYCNKTATIWLIALPQKMATHPLRQQDYVKAPFQVDIKKCQRWGEEHQVYLLHIQCTGNLQLTDENLLASSSVKTQQRVLRDLRKRDERYAIVASVLARGATRPGLLTAHEALGDPRLLRQRIRETATEHGVSKTTVQHLVHLFWAGGSQVNTLMPRYHQCGVGADRKLSHL